MSVKIIGAALVAAPFVLVGVVSLAMIGITGTLLVFSFTGLVCGSIALDLYLMSDKEDEPQRRRRNAMLQ